MEKKKFRCAQCDELIDEDATVCPHCGLDFGSSEPIDKSYNNTNNISEEKSEGMNFWQILAVIYGILAFIGIISISSTLNNLNLESAPIILTLIASIVLSVSIIYGFGVLIKNTKSADNTLKRIEKLLDKKVKK